MTSKTPKSVKIAAVIAASFIGFSTTAFAVDEHNVVSGFTAVGAPLGLHGTDPVAFIDIGNRITGTAAHAAKYDGVAYYFSSEKNQKDFSKNPEKYIPENGGYCTFGTSVGKKFDGDPKYAEVVDGKLYVFLNEDIFKLYQKDRAGTISKAAKQWKKIEHKAVSSL